MRARAFLSGLFLGALFLLLYHPTLVWLAGRYAAPDSHYAHGFLVPFIVAYILWLRRREARATIGEQGNRVGFALVACALAVHISALFAGVHAASAFTFLPLAFGVSLALVGTAATRKIASALLFLVFMLPLPLAVLNAVSFPLRLFATKAAVFILSFAGGIPVHHEGFRILLPHDSLVVGSPCSGLRSVIALTALAALGAFLFPGNAPRKALLFASAVPLALLSNIVRLLALCLGTYWYGWRAVQGTVHDVSGLLSFLLALASLGIVMRLLAGPPGRSRTGFGTRSEVRP